MENIDTSLRIDVGSVLRSRLPRMSRFLPDVAVRWLERVICQDRMNEILDNTRGRRGVDFARGVLDELSVTYTAEGRLPDDPRVIVVCNHPLGGLDGLVMTDFVATHYGRDDIGFVVNDLLGAVEPLTDVFLPVNKHGKQSRASVARLDEAFASDRPVVMFPSGMVSRRNSSGLVRDLSWQKMVVNKAIEYHRDVVPVHFSGENSSFFYKFARLRTMIGLKFNIEMILLPGEIFRSEGSSYRLTVGQPVVWQTLCGGKDASQQAERLCQSVYSLVNQEWKQ